jgi:nucleoid-associated protein YgaU
MRRPHRMVMALALLAGGAGVALVSRRPAETARPPALSEAVQSANSSSSLPLALVDEPLQEAHLSGTIEAVEPTADPPSDPFRTQEAAVASTPSDQADAKGSWRPSTRTASYQAKSSRGSISREAGSGTSAPMPKAATAYLTHRIVDGDTLSGLAQRYLGSSARFHEIFIANRDRLQTPDVLPIGVELRIPVSR